MRVEECPPEIKFRTGRQITTQQSCLRIVVRIINVLSHVELLELQFDHSGAMRSDLRRPGVCLRHPGAALGLAMGSR